MTKLEKLINNRLVELARFEKIEQIEKELIEFGFIEKEEKGSKYLKCPDNQLWFYIEIKFYPNIIQIERNYKEKGEWAYDNEFIELDYEENIEDIVKQITSMVEEMINCTTMLYV